MNPAWAAIEQGWTDRERRGELLIRGHSLGHCVRRQVLGQLDMPTKPYPGKLVTAMADSSVFEDQVIGWLERFHVITDRQRPYTLEVLPGRAFIALHPDGLAAAFTSATHVLEVKSFGQSLYDKFDKGGLAAFPEYEWQVSAEMHAAELPGLVVVALKDGTINDLKFEYVTAAPHSMAEIERRVGEIWGEWRAVDGLGKPHQQLQCDMGARSWGCPYYHLGRCPQPEALELTGKEGLRLEQMARWLDNAIDRRKQAEADERKWRDQLLAGLNEAGLSKAVTRTHVITAQQETVSERIDTAKLKRQAPDWYRSIMQDFGTTLTRRATVRVVARERAEGEGDGKLDAGTEGHATG